MIFEGRLMPSPATMSLAIFGRITERTDEPTLRSFFDYLRKKSLGFRLYHAYKRQLQQVYPDLLKGREVHAFETREEIRDCHVVYCLGGDGTVLEAVRFAGTMALPIMGINFGRLGYLASAPKAEIISATEELLLGHYKIDERSLLSVSSEPEGLFGTDNFGINDLTIHKSNTNEMITVHAYINGHFLNSYWGDGVIIATPTGSTAYSLSCGGPIVFPDCASLVITPVAPHSLTLRPMIIPEDSQVSFRIESRSGEAMVALDTRTERVASQTIISVCRADFKARLVRVLDHQYVNTLRRSLMWGNDSRN